MEEIRGPQEIKFCLVPQHTSTVAPQYTSTVVPYYTSTVVPQYTSTVVPQYNSTVVPQCTSTAVPQYTSTAVQQYNSTAVPQYTSTVMLVPELSEISQLRKNCRSLLSFWDLMSVRWRRNAIISEQNKCFSWSVFLNLFQMSKLHRRTLIMSNVLLGSGWEEFCFSTNF